MTAALACHDVTVVYDREPVLRGLTLAVQESETVAVLGPSGSGKTTLLSTVAGFLRPAAGEIRVGGVPVASDQVAVPPEARDVGVVFQHYALWPHLTAEETVAYPFRRRGVPAREAHRRARGLLGVMGIGELAGRRPAELSGGQQQRVGLARALAREAGLYLFDEPTAHLDAALRAALQAEVTQRRRQAGAAALYATHDAAEALAVADRIALLRDGRVVQVGTPAEVYERPADLWAARLTGPASVVTVEVHAVTEAGLELRIAGRPAAVTGEGAPGTSSALVRPDWATLGGPLPGTVAAVAYRGPHTDYRLDTPSGEVTVRCPGPPRARTGERPGWHLRRVHLIG